MRFFKINSIILLICSILFLSSCTPIIKDGLDEFSDGTSSMSLTGYLLPNADFVSQFNYIDGDYHYYDNDRLGGDALEKVFMVLKYDSQIYSESKDYCISNLNLSESNIKKFNQYVFMENLGLPEAYEHMENGVNKEFPYFFNMFGYNDDTCELFFIGFRCGEDLYADADIIHDNLETFLEHFYSEYYSFK